MKYSELKNKIKDLAQEIKQLKSTRKQCKDGYVNGLSYIQSEFRHHHIAASELRGRTREEIEQPGPNAPYLNEKTIEQIKASIEPREVQNEDVCHNAA